MKYFIETEQLLIEPSFLKYAGRIYEQFVDLDYDAHLHEVNNGETFKLNVTRWLQLAEKKEPRRIFSGGSGSFLLYMRCDVEGIIHKDWEHFNTSLDYNDKKGQLLIAEFLGEVEEVRRVTKNRQYLKPLLGTIDKVLDSMMIEYADQASKPVKPTLNGKDIDLEPMQWNGNINALTTLFYDLSKKQLSNKRMALNATTKQIKAFILTCFVNGKGEPFEASTINTYFQEDKPGKKSKGKNKIDVDELFKHDD